MSPVKAVDLLIVEDNPDDLELTLRSLKRSRIPIHEHVARDGEEAIHFLFGRSPGTGAALLAPPRLILLDLKLPKIDGLEILKQIKSHPRTRSIPVVVLSSSQQEHDVTECYRHGANSYLVKPVEFAKFTEAIAQAGRYWLTLNIPPR